MSDVWDVEEAEVKHVKPTLVVGGARWEGEDEEEDIKDNWEDSDVEDDKEKEKEAEEKAQEGTAVKVKKKRSLKNIISEKEERMRLEAEERKKAAEQAKSNLSPEDAFAEKLRQQRLQEEADLKLALETFGLTNETVRHAGHGIESMQPSNKEEFDTLRKALVETLAKHEKSSFYVVFLDELFRDLCLNIDAEDMKKLGNTLQMLGNEKNKAAKALKGKKKAGKGKASLVLGRDTDYSVADDYAGNEYDDFM